MELHPPTLLLATAAVAAALVLLLLSTRVGLGAAARGMRTWLVGDVMILAGQGLSTLVLVSTGTAPPPLTVTSGFLAAGIALHVVAIHRHRHPPSPADRWWLGAGFFVGLAMWLASAALPSVVARAVLFDALLLGLIGYNLVRNLWPERRFLGIRLLIAAQLFALAANLALLLAVIASAEVAGRQTSVGMIFSIVMPLLTTTSFVLWLQEELRETLEAQARTDALTGVLNRHGVLPQLQRDFLQTLRLGGPLSVAICDIDRFKAINDRLGHAGGDDVLRHFAHALQGHVRRIDLVARWGGEEFLVVLPGTDAAGAAAVLERLRARPAGQPLDAFGRVTFSAGVACTAEPNGFVSVEALIARADARLYLAKVPRDAVVLAGGNDVVDASAPLRTC